MSVRITFDNVREWFPAPPAENPFAADAWWQLQSVGLIAALRILHLVQDPNAQQRALHQLRESINTAQAAVFRPTEAAIAARMAQTLAPTVNTPMSVVLAMLRLANVQPGDVLIDLGSGDGRIVFAAAQLGAHAIGIEIDADLVRACHGVHPRATFLHQDVERADLSRATVVTCYLLSQSMINLAPRLRSLRPGTRIVSHAFDMGCDGDWSPKYTVDVDGHTIYMWVV